MPDDATRGDHDYVDAHSPEELRAGLRKKLVFDVERAAIKKRREYIKNNGGGDRTGAPLTGLALSGGGIRSASFGLGRGMRSASFGLGALQALHAYSGIEGIDYLSTVSGGGYIGCSLTAALQKTDGEFPLTNPTNYDDTDSVRHLRDYCNYLVPHGAWDALTALGIYCRGLVANVLIILPVLLFFVWLTLLIHPTVESLREPKLLVWNLRDGLAPLGLPVSHPFWKLPGFWFTAILAVVNIVFLVFWAFAKSISTSQLWRTRFARLGKPAELSGGLVTLAKILFLVTLVSLCFETQPFILRG